MNEAMLTPGISTGYWKPMNSPSHARLSTVISKRFFPSNVTLPPVTVNLSRPANTDANVLLPEPLGPIMACTSPALTERSMPFNISLSSTEAFRFFISNI